MEFQDVIKQLMQENGLSQQGLADVLGVNQTTVGQWLRGKKKPGYDSIRAIYDKFGVYPNALFGLDRGGGNAASDQARPKIARAAFPGLFAYDFYIVKAARAFFPYRAAAVLLFIRFLAEQT